MYYRIVMKIGRCVDRRVVTFNRIMGFVNNVLSAIVLQITVPVNTSLICSPTECKLIIY